MRSQRVLWLDELRGLAAWGVMTGHYIGYLREAGYLSQETVSLGFLARGVQLFYVLSGFLLYRIYRDRFEDPGVLVAYFTKRVFRILPMFAFASVTAFAFFAMLEPWRRFDLGAELLAQLFIFPMAMRAEWAKGIIGV